MSLELGIKLEDTAFTNPVDSMQVDSKQELQKRIFQKYCQ